MGLLSRFSKALTKTREVLNTDVGDLVQGRTEVDQDLLDRLEEALILADVGADLSLEIVEEVRQRASKSREDGDLRSMLVDIVIEKLGDAAPERDRVPLEVIFAVGVNGVGKTTTLAKLARRSIDDGRRPMLAAGDTFRAAAAEQLEVWAERVGVPCVRKAAGADPAAVVYEALQAARKNERDVVLVDTAGRLHNKRPLMDELAKLRRIAGREVEGAPHEVLLVLDATTGSNGLQQAREFQEIVGATGVVLTKLDGTAKGGVVLQIRRELGLPVRWIGVGEGIGDLERFDSREFAEAML